ncbi:MAG: winged helix-turn-helix transcriptional regulator [Bradyrhizobiaceae bacterium]|nr:winged helix-turn-helix transcriptional regulator [Bradyrhizobiaceae bacterium]
MHRDDRDIYNKPGHLIRRLQQIAVAVFLSKTEGFDITPVQYSALLALNNHPGIDQTTLMQIIAFDRSTIGEVIGRLAAKGLVKRAVGKTDRRTKHLEITPAGRRLLASIRPINEDVQKTILAPLSPAERRQFVQIARKLVEQNNERSRVPLKSRTAKRGGRG